MAIWEKVKIYYQTVLGSAGSTLSATSTAQGTDVKNIYSMLEVNRWEAASNAQQVITYDAGSGQLTNGDFETGDTTGWEISVGAGAAATFTAQTAYVIEGAWSGMVTVTSGGTLPSDINIYQTNKKILKGRTYALIFQAKTPSANKTVYADIVSTKNSYLQYSEEGQQQAALTSTTQIFKIVFTANTTAADAAVRFLLGGNTVDFIVDYVSFGEAANYASDYIAILGHNLQSASAQVKIQYGDDGTGFTDAFAEYPSSDAIYLKEWTSPGYYRHWRLVLSGQTVAPYMSICVWGPATELDFATASFDPYGQAVQANINLSNGGYLTGIHTKYSERRMTLVFHDADSILYDRVNRWWETSGLNNFFVAWERGDHPSDVFLMRPDTKYNNPLKDGGLYRDITLSLIGRKE